MGCWTHDTPAGHQTGGDYALGGCAAVQRDFARCGGRMDLRAWCGPGTAKRTILRLPPRPADGGHFAGQLQPRTGPACKPRQLYGRSLICCCLAEPCWIMSASRPPDGARPRPCPARQRLLRRGRSVSAHITCRGSCQAHAATRRPLPQPLCDGSPLLFWLDRALLRGADAGTTPPICRTCAQALAGRTVPAGHHDPARRPRGWAPSDRPCCRRRDGSPGRPRRIPPRAIAPPTRSRSQSRLLGASALRRMRGPEILAAVLLALGPVAGAVTPDRRAAISSFLRHCG